MVARILLEAIAHNFVAGAANNFVVQAQVVPVAEEVVEVVEAAVPVRVRSRRP